MAKNFRICRREKGNRTLDIKLFGDFDASSACELIHVLNESADRATKMAIDTDGLRNINVFGLDVLLPRLSGLANNRSDIEITGRFSSAFLEQ
jgi:stage II sporulation protein AA (anti-sigma F factor antagonist)